ncbi:GrpB family protein [Phycicoccus sp. Root101]
MGALCLSVEHVGSTSVPGLSAKPVIDILLLGPDSDE